MVKKKVKKKTSKKINTKTKKIIRSAIRSSPEKRSIKKKFNLVLYNLIIFIVLFVASALLYLVSNNDFYSNVFYLLAILLGFISIAFLIVLLVFVFVKLNKK